MRLPGTVPPAEWRLTSPMAPLVDWEAPCAPGLQLSSTFLLAVRDPAIATELRRFFVDRGLRPVVAADGNEVLARLQECRGGRCPIDLVVADVDLPGVSGVDILRTVHEMG